jgi:MoaA/NifB/PqqE/SkfB family radical SAM enzyme
MLKSNHFSFNIDVVGSCNLQCPSCPVGNSEDVYTHKGFMEPELLNSIMKKATSECEVLCVSLYNWTEPLLHPNLPELVNIVQSYGVSCHLSSNLNILKNVDLLLSANPATFRISNSGFTQEIYGATHKGGKIERVKKNMITLAESKKRTNSATKIHVLYHRYLTNLEEEYMMKKFAQSLGFDFIPVWAFMMPLEKLLAYADSMEENSMSPILSPEDYNTIGKLALPLKEAFEVSSRYSDRSCTLKDDQITMDFHANVKLCCSVFDSSRFNLASYLTTPISVLQELKYSANSEVTCSKCMKHGIHIYGTYGTDKLNDVAIKNIISHSPIIGLKLYFKEIILYGLINPPKKIARRIKQLIRSVISLFLNRFK